MAFKCVNELDKFMFQDAESKENGVKSGAYDDGSAGRSSKA